MAYGSSIVNSYKVKNKKKKKSYSSAKGNMGENRGGLLGGLGYVGKSALAGLGGVVEGVIDGTLALGADLTGNHEYAKYVFKDNVVGTWFEEVRDDYNPGGVMSFLGDVSQGVGQSSVLFIPYAGAPLFFMGVMSQGISGAAAQTGEVGVKEAAYGLTTGAVEAGLEYLGGAAAKGAKSIASATAKNTGKAAIKSVVGNATRKGLASKILSSAASEFLEEAASEIIDTGLQRAYKINPDKELNWNDVLYAGLVGAVSGAVTTSAVEIPQTINNRAVGERIIKNGNSQTLVNTANLVADKLAGAGTEFKNAPEWVKRLRGEVDAYNKLADDKKVGAQGATILGEMQASLYFSEMQAVNSGLTESIQNASEDDRAALAEYINLSVEKKNRKKDYTAEDIAKDVDGVAKQLAIMKMAGGSFFNYEAAMADKAREGAIDNKVAYEQAKAMARAEQKVSATETTSADNATMGAAAEQAAATPNITIPKADDTVAMKAEDAMKAQKNAESAPAMENEAAQAAPVATNEETEIKADLKDDVADIEASATVVDDDINRISNNVRRAVSDIKVDGKLYELTDKHVNNIARGVQKYIREGMSESEAIALAVNRLVDIKSIGEESGVKHEVSKATLEKVRGAVVNAYRAEMQSTTKEASKTAQEAREVAEGTEAQKTAEKSAEKKGEGKAAEKSSEAKEKSSERKNEESQSGEPKISEAKESLTDDQRKEKARKRAERMIEWEKKTAPTVKELNSAREYVKGFDNLSQTRKASIVRMIRSADGKVDTKTLKGVANLIAAMPRADVEIRFAEGLGGDLGGFYAPKVGGKALIVIDSSTNFKKTIQGTIAHELVHHLEKNAGYKEFAKFVMSRVKPEKKAEVEKRYTEFYTNKFTAEAKARGMSEAEAVAYVKEKLSSEKFKSDVESEVVAKYVGQALNNEKLLKKYADKDKKLMAKVGEWLWEKVKTLKKNKEKAPEGDQASYKDTIKVAEEMALMVAVLVQETDTVGESNGGTKYDTEAKKKITIGMSDSERAEVLKNRNIVAPIYEGQADSVIAETKKQLEKEKKSFGKEAVVDIAERLELINEKIDFDDVEVQILLSRGNIEESITKEASPEQIAKLLPILKQTSKNAVAIERHRNRYYHDTDTVYFDNLLGGYVDGNNLVPVRFGLKHSRTGNTTLYVVVNQNEISIDKLTEIKKDRGHSDNGAKMNGAENPLRSVNYSISQIFKFVNSKDLLRYIPDNFLNDEQKTLKLEAIVETEKYTDQKNDKKYDNFIKNGNIRAAKNMLSAKAKAEGYITDPETGTVYKHGSKNVKTADITYDDAGKLIPISKRYDDSVADVRYDLADEDSAYMEAVERGDMETAQRMVDEAAKAAGYDSPMLYHGTRSFGFTEFDFAKADDHISIFATTEEAVAKTYTSDDPKTAISERADITPEELEGSTEEELLYYLQKYVDEDFRIAEVRTKSARELIVKARGDLDAFIKDNAERIDERKGNILANMSAAVEALEAAVTYDDFSNAYSAYEREVWALKWADSELMQDLRPLIVADLSRAYNAIATVLENEGVAYTDGERVIYRQQALNIIRPQLFSGVYRLYGKTGNALIIEGDGANWNELDGRDIGKRGKVSTRDVVEYALRHGYDSVIFNNIVDTGSNVADGVGESTVYAFLREGALKSADAITYDDDGNIILPSERFNPDVNDVRYDLAEEPKSKAKTKAEIAAENSFLKKRNRELNDALITKQNKISEMREKLARERAELSKAENAEVFDKSDVELAVKSIESWTEEEALSLAKGNVELNKMGKAKREEMISQIYIALHEQGAVGRTGPGSIAVKSLAAKIAGEYIDSAAVMGEDGKLYHLADIYDEVTMGKLKQELTNLLYGEFAHMGKSTGVNELVARMRAQKQAFRQERFNDATIAKAAKDVAYQAHELRKLAEQQKREGATEGIQRVTNKMAQAADAKGNVSVKLLDTAIGEASRFLSGEAFKSESISGEEAKKESILDFDAVVDGELKFKIDEYLRLREEHKHKTLTAEEMRLAGEILRKMKATIERYNKEYINGHYVEVDELVVSAVSDLISFAGKQKDYKNKVTKFLREKLGKKANEWYFYQILSPETVIEAIEGYKQGGLLKSLYHSVRVAKQKAEHRAVQMKKPFAEFLDNKENAWEEEKDGKIRKHSYRNKLNKKIINVNGNEITLGEAIYLLMLTKREHAHRGLQESGYKCYSDDGQVTASFKVLDIERTRDLIYNQLDKTDLEFLKMAEEFFNVTSTKVKQDADYLIFGYTNTQDTYYVPIIRDRYSRMNGVTDARQSIGSIITVYNKSFNQNTVQNAKALEGKSIMRIINDHADGLADYAEMYLPLKAFDRVYNRGVIGADGKTTTIREVVGTKVWNGAEGYFKELFQDVQGQSRQNDSTMLNRAVGFMRSAWVNSVLGANIKVVATQTTSLGAATQIIEPKYITAALSVIGKRDLSELRTRAYEYSDIIEARKFDMGALKAQGNIDKVGKIGEKTGFLIGWMDERICFAIFHAAELKVEAQGGGAVGTEANAIAAARIADEAIYTTQAMSSASERSALQRSPNEIAKVFSMFTSDSVKNLSHLYGNIMKFIAHSERVKAGDASYEALLENDKKEILRSARTIAITGIMLGVITQAFKYLYAKEEEEPEDKLKDFGLDIVSSTLNILPGVSDVIDKFVFNYDMSVNVLDVANDTIETFGKGAKLAGKSMNGEFVSTQDVASVMIDIIKSTLSFGGIPISPIERTVTGLLRRVAPSAIYGYDAMFYNPSYTSDLKAAVESGDDALAEHVLSTLYKNEVTGVYTSDELGEVVRLYGLTDEEGKHYNVLPQKIGTEINGVKLTSAQRKRFTSIYSGASGKVNEFIDSSYYQTLTDEQRAKAIKNIYALYYNRAAAEVVGETWTNAQAYSKLTSNYSALFAAQAYKSGLSAYKDALGREVTVREQLDAYMQSLGLSDIDYLVISYALGYKGKDNKAAMISYINSLSLAPEVKAQIAERLGFSVKGGVVVEKEEV